MTEKWNNETMKRGFTLIEVMVAVFVFSAITAVVAGLFLYAVRIQRSVLAQQELLDQTSYVMEYMSRALRMARKELAAPACLSQNGLNYEINPSTGGVRFINSDGECQEFFLETSTNRLKEWKGGPENYLTSDIMEILFFVPVLAGESQTDNLQPRVTVLLELKRKSAKPEGQPAIKLQTTISQRNLDVELAP